MSYLDEMDSIANQYSEKEPQNNKDYLDKMDEIAATGGSNADIVSQNGQNSENTQENTILDRVARVPRGLLKGMAAYSEGIGDAGRNLYSPEYTGDPDKIGLPPATKVAEKFFDKLYGKDLTPRDSFDKALQGTGEILTPMPIPGGPIYGSGVKALAKYAGKSALAATGASAAINLTPRIYDEGTVHGAIEDVVKAILGGMAGGAAPGTIGNFASKIKNSSNLSDAEKRVSTYLQDTLGQEGSTTAAENIKSTPEFPLTMYEPATAEVANTPLFSQLNRLREGIPGSGLSEHAGTQNRAINETADVLSSGKSTSQEIKDVIGSELSARKAKRHTETNPLYEELSHEETQIDPKNLRDFLNDKKVVKGKKKKDLENIMELIKPSRILTPEEKLAVKKYKNEKKSILQSTHGEEAKKTLLSKLAKPKPNHPTVADLDEARQNINDKINELKRSGQNSRVQQYKKAKAALDKDLEVFPKQAEITAKYAELSKPINEILEHPVLSKLPESRKNDIFSQMYNDSSYDNVTRLKRVLKDKPELWKGFQDATVDYVMKSIRNAGAEGKSNVLSYHKLNKFLDKHEKSLKEVFTKDQTQFLEELKNATKGRNVASTLGLEKGSPTYGKLIAGTHLNEGVISKFSKGLERVHAAPIPKFAKSSAEGLNMLLSSYLKKREASVMSIVDKVLKEPEYAHKLITHKFKNQYEFNREMNRVVKQSTSALINEKKQDEKDDS